MEDRSVHVQQAAVTPQSENATLALNLAGDAIVTVDASGRITMWNAAAERLLGHEASDAVGQTLALVIPERNRPRHIAGFHEAMQQGHLAHDGAPARVEAITANGSTVTLAMSLGLLTGEDGTRTGAVAILREAVIELVPFAAPAHQQRATTDRRHD